MIEFVSVRGDLLQSKDDVLVNAVNKVGVMGAGIALEFKNKFPDMFESYKKFYTGANFRQDCHVWKEDGTGQFIFNFVTKDHFIDKSNYGLVEDSMDQLIQFIKSKRMIKSISMPKVGCGLGGLSWTRVKKMIKEEFEKAFKKDEREILVHFYDG